MVKDTIRIWIKNCIIYFDIKLRYEEMMKVKTGESNLEEKDKKAMLLQEYGGILSKNKSN